MPPALVASFDLFQNHHWHHTFWTDNCIRQKLPKWWLFHSHVFFFSRNVTWIYWWTSSICMQWQPMAWAVPAKFVSPNQFPVDLCWNGEIAPFLTTRLSHLRTKKGYFLRNLKVNMFQPLDRWGGFRIELSIHVFAIEDIWSFNTYSLRVHPKNTKKYRNTNVALNMRF